MASQQLLVIDGWEVPMLISYDVEYNKLWGEDSGRDMEGNDVSTLIGFFPKLYVNVGSWNQQQMQSFLKRVNKSKFDIDWYDEEIGGMRKGISYYVNDYTISLKDSKRMRYRGFSFNLIPNKKR